MGVNNIKSNPYIKSNTLDIKDIGNLLSNRKVVSLLNIFQIAEAKYVNGEASSDDEVFQRLRARMAK